jgi:hypothetical protein
MNLPVILDIAIGLVFIYLILSLLASEIQELFTTLLQWRAIHLKKSIQSLLTGEEVPEELNKSQEILKSLYNNPLIKGINQEAKDGMAGMFRSITWKIAEGYGWMMDKMGKNKILGGHHSAPSYIPAEIFANTLFDSLQFNELSQKLTVLNIRHLVENDIYLQIITFIFDHHAKLDDTTRNYLREEANNMKTNLDHICDQFQEEKFTLSGTIKKLKTELNFFYEDCRRHFDKSAVDAVEIENEFMSKINYIVTDLFADEEQLRWRVQPTVNQILELGDKSSKFYQSIKADLGDVNSPIYQTFKEIETHVQDHFDKLPNFLKDNLKILAKKAGRKINKTELEVQQFQKEIEIWFDSSMDRAGGVYKRNAKGVAFIIGCMIAGLANADTFNIVSQLAKNSTLRATISQSASQVVANNPKETATLKDLSKQTNQVLSDIALPIGWECTNLQEQLSVKDIKKYSCNPEETVGKKPSLLDVFSSPKVIFGWIISGAAISMGASFWFDLLGKIINVRNTGSRPKSSSKTEETEG